MLEKKLNQIEQSIVSLKDLAASFTNGDHGGINYTKDGVRYLRGQSVTEQGLEFTDERYISIEDHTRMIRAEVIPGDVLLTIAGSIGNCCVVRGVERANINQAIVKIRPSASFDSDYLSIFLNSRYGKFQINRLANGAVQLNVNFSEVGDIQVVIPSLEIQRSLVAEIEAARQIKTQKLAQADELLSSLDVYLLARLGLSTLQEDYQNAYAIKLSQIRNGRYDSWYHAPRFIKIAKELEKCNFPLTSLGNIVLNPVGGATPRRSDSELYTDTGVKFLRILNVKPYEIDLTDIKFIVDLVHAGELARSQLKKDDILMTITGRVGTAAVVTQEILPANINQHIVRLRIQRTDCLPTYLAAYLNSSIGLNLSNRSVTGGTRIALDYEAIRNLQVPLPPLDIQKSIINEVETRRIKAQQLRQEADIEWDAAKTCFEQKLLGEEG